MNEQKLINVIAKLLKFSDACLQSCGFVDKCTHDCEKCVKDYLTAETEVETETEVEKEEPRKELYTALLKFINEWKVNYVCIFTASDPSFYYVDLESDCEELAVALTDLAYDFNGDDCCLSILKNFENTSASLVNAFADICDIYWRD